MNRPTTSLPALPRLLAATAISLVMAGPVGLAATSPAEGPGDRTSAACPAGPGVTVLVDFGPYGGTDIRCAPHDVDTGLAALDVAGFDWVGTAQFADFVCRINGLPTVADDPCVRTPPADAYWSYWVAARGGVWEYQSQSAGTVDPPPGSVQGWSFGAGDPPGTAPPAPPASPPPPPPPPPPTSTSAPQTTEAGGGGDEPSTSAPAAPTPAPTTTPPTTSASGQPPSSGSTSASDRDSSSPAAQAVGTAGDDDAGGSPLGTVIGLVVAAAVAATGGVIALRRRHGVPAP